MANDVKLCECGCGQPVSPGKRFRQGHWSRTKEAKKILGSESSRQARSESRRRWQESLTEEQWQEYLDKVQSTEARDKRSQSMKEAWANRSPDERERILTILANSPRPGPTMTPELHAVFSERSKRMWDNRTEEERKAISAKISKALKGKTLPQEVRDKISATLKGHHYHDSDSEAVRKWRKWAETPEGQDALRRGAHAAAKVKEYTSIEILMYAALDELGINYIPQHTIDDRFKVDAYLPDIPLILEAWGTYWHADPRSGKYDRDDIDNLTKGQRSNVHQDIRKERYFAKASIPIISMWEIDLQEDAIATVRSALESYL